MLVGISSVLNVVGFSEGVSGGLATELTVFCRSGKEDTVGGLMGVLIPEAALAAVEAVLGGKETGGSTAVCLSVS